MSYNRFNYSNIEDWEIKQLEKKSILPDSSKSISYAERSIGTIYITGGGFIKRPFTGIGSNSRFGWQELVWFKQPSRAMNFAFSNMDQISVGLVARCEINIKYMNYQDYMDLRKILGRERHFIVEFFDTDEGDWVSRDMYCAENNLSQFFSLKQSLIGVLDYSIKLVGTNLDLEERLGCDATEQGPQLKQMEITYHSHDGSSVTTRVSWGSVITTESDTLFVGSSGTFSHWKRIKNGQVVGVYGANQKTTVWEDMDFYAVWE